MMNNPTNPREAISQYIKDTREHFNPIFFQRNEDEIITELMNVIYSCERENPYFTIKVHSYRVVDNYDEINSILYSYYEDMNKNKNKKKKRDNQYDYINIKESAIRLLIVTYYVKDSRGTEEHPSEEYFDVLIAIPRIVEKYYFKINGIMRSTLFQIVDGSTYNNGTSNAKVPSITFKIVFMAARVTRYFDNSITTTAGENLKLTYYHSRIFNKGISAVKYILAKYGYYGTLDFLGLNGAIYLSNYDPKDENMYTISPSNEVYISSPKILLDKNPIIQTLFLTLYKNIVPGLPYEIIFDDKYWVRSLGAEFGSHCNEKIYQFYNPEDGNTIADPLEKGYSILSSFESIYDISTRKSVRLPEEDKATTYHIFRWIMREFNALRLKDNLDINYKRIRFAEYIASLYAFKIVKGIYRVSDMNKKAGIINIKKAIRTDPSYLLNAISTSRMVSYRNMVSDMDAMQALKFTYKGISGLGEGSNNSIPEIYRSIYPSHIGKVDLDSSSDGNPGITGTICPYAPIYEGGFFEDYQEPNTWDKEFFEAMESYKKTINIRDAMIFDSKLTGKDYSDQIAVANEVIATMQSIIKPVINADEGEIVSLEEICNV